MGIGLLMTAVFAKDSVPLCMMQSWPVVTFRSTLFDSLRTSNPSTIHFRFKIRSPLNSVKPVTNKKSLPKQMTIHSKFFVAWPLRTIGVSMQSSSLGQFLQGELEGSRAWAAERPPRKKEQITVNLPLLSRNFPLRPIRWLTITVPLWTFGSPYR